MRSRILVAMSGGIDSSVAALLLRMEGHDVAGVFMRNGVSAEGASRSCCSASDAYDARRIADRLGIPFYSLNLKEEFGRIMDEFAAEYEAGRTPNPCVLCNRDLKFGRLVRLADELGMDRVATGHYARIDRRQDRWTLLRAADPAKDQSYVLFPLSQAQLARSLFPLGTLSKARTREIARGAGLPIADKPDSQEICFVPGDDYRAWLRERAPDRLKPGRLETVDGRDVGAHQGHQNFTIGQRRGLGVALGRRTYVVGIRPETGTVVLGSEQDLLRREARIERINWVSIEPPAGRIRAEIRLRHGQRPVLCWAEPDVAPGRVIARFDEPQKIVTPGQAAVLYKDDVVLGGGWIASAA